MKIMYHIVRVLFGALFVFSSLAFFFELVPQPELEGNVREFMEGVMATGYLMFLIKATELVCGIAILLGRFVALALVIIAPVVLNIFLFHLFVEPTGMIMGVVLVVATLFLAYVQREKYRPLFHAR